MLINDMFKKNIDRDISGVVKVGQLEEKIVKQELEEYVVTKELERHFREFYSSYNKSIGQDTDKMGVWISGFFGSGKSHFLKILSYLLDDKNVDGKKAIDYLIDENKISDEITIANMKKAASIPSDVILFNIDAKSEITGTKDLDVLVGVFLKVFNEKLGYSTEPHMAELERKLTKDGYYAQFQERFKEIAKVEWVDNRHESKFMKSNITKSLVDIGFMSETDAESWFDTTKFPYSYNVERFVDLIKEHIDTQDDDYHIAFLVDEMGQFIGENNDLMLNLQTITEELGNKCHGKAWIIVTSQQEIDTITKISGDDFSKIQGRFDTRVSLTSANVDEVIKLRVLDKNETGRDTLSILYDQNETVLKNLLTFENGPEMKIFKTKEDFIEVYPFIPYQFFVLSKVLPGIRKQGASGKHLSEGERSLLALFKESGERLKDKEDGTLAPFHIFYEALSKWLDHSHAGVIAKAYENDNINPHRSDEVKENFTIDVLKTLFLIKYVDEVESNLENIVTFMVSNIEDKRANLEEKVKKSLRILSREMLIQKNGNIYTFLTDEEQEINREIQHQNISNADLINAASEIFFEDIYTIKNIAIDDKNRFPFNFDRIMDDVPFVKQSNAYVLSIITPQSNLNGKEEAIKFSTVGGGKVCVDLPGDRSFLEEIEQYLRINAFLTNTTSTRFNRFEEMRIIKSREMKEHEDRAKRFLEDALDYATIYLNGSVFSSEKNIKDSITDALKASLETVYEKFNYIQEYKEERDVTKLFHTQRTGQTGVDTDYKNQNAIEEVNCFIMLNTKNLGTISLKEIKDAFVLAPYGWGEMDIAWIVGKLFINGNIGYKYNGKELHLANTQPDEFSNYLTKKNYADKIQIVKKEIIPPNLIKSAKDVAVEVFGKLISREETDYVYQEFYELLENKLITLREDLKEYEKGTFYPGEDIIKRGIELLTFLKGNYTTKESFEEINRLKDELLDFSDDYSDVNNFFSSEQIEHWEKSTLYKDRYEEGKTFIHDKDIVELYEQICKIINNNKPYSRIKDLPELNNKFMKSYTNLLEKEFNNIKREIEYEKKEVKDHLDERKDIKDKHHNEIETLINSDFLNLYKKAEEQESIQIMKSYISEAEAIRKNLIVKIDSIPVPQPEPSRKPLPDLIKIKNINIKSIISSLIWEIKDERDIEKYLKELERELKAQLEDNTIIKVKL